MLDDVSVAEPGTGVAEVPPLEPPPPQATKDVKQTDINKVFIIFMTNSLAG